MVISSHRDAHIPYVQKHLDEPMLIFDPIVDPTHNLSYDFDHGHSRVIYDGTELTGVRSIWYRKPYYLKWRKAPVAKHNAAYVSDALQRHEVALTAGFPDALWISNYYDIERAGYKPAQISVAKRLGFRVPDTIFTSDASKAQTFLKQHGHCVVKNVANEVALTPAGRPLRMLTREITKQNSPDFSGLYLAPSIFQQSIQSAADWRVTVVGEKVFAARITTAGLDPDSPDRNWAIATFREGASYNMEPRELPEDISEKCVAHAKKFNLKFSAIDLIEDKKGNLWFLENNPNGQWAFVERATGQPIGKAIADLLTAPK